jgi:hypothetical protein
LQLMDNNLVFTWGLHIFLLCNKGCSKRLSCILGWLCRL